MTGRRYEIPSTAALLAFEATARLGSITRAAEERGISHSAISRHVRALEKSLGSPLFERRGRGVVLSANARPYFTAVQSAMEAVRNAGRELDGGGTVLTIGCTLETWELVLRPEVPKLTGALGVDVTVRFVIFDYDARPLVARSALDIDFECPVTPHPDPAAVLVLHDESVPVASPGFVERWAGVLARHPRDWRGVPRLDFAQHVAGWTTWESWFAAQGCAPPSATVAMSEHYHRMLPEAVAGRGIALGWNHYISEYLDSGQLVPLRGAWLRSGRGLYALATATGAAKPPTQACLGALVRAIDGRCRPEIASPFPREPG